MWLHILLGMPTNLANVNIGTLGSALKHLVMSATAPTNDMSSLRLDSTSDDTTYHTWAVHDEDDCL